jgi:hypothetical protein
MNEAEALECSEFWRKAADLHRERIADARDSVTGHQKHR